MACAVHKSHNVTWRLTVRVWRSNCLRWLCDWPPKRFAPEQHKLDMHSVQTPHPTRAISLRDSYRKKKKRLQTSKRYVRILVGTKLFWPAPRSQQAKGRGWRWPRRQRPTYRQQIPQLCCSRRRARRGSSIAKSWRSICCLCISPHCSASTRRVLNDARAASAWFSADMVPPPGDR